MAKEIRFAVIDAETDPFEFGRIPRPFLWGFFDGDNYEQFDSTDDLIECVSNYEGIVYGHNAGKFDFFFLLDAFEPWEEMMIINGRISKAKIGQCELRDSYNIIPAPLAAYMKDEIDYAIFEESERYKPENFRKICAYLKTDCIYLHDLVKRFIDEYGLCLTQAGSSMKQWKKIAPIDVPKTDEFFYNDFAPYYYGGRVQCFEKGIINDKFHVVDINSAYPFAMLHRHPYSANYSAYDGFEKEADFYKVHCISAGAFPFRGMGSGLSFPNDNESREYTITKWEYQAAIDTDTIKAVRVLQSIKFCGHVDFADYVNKFYALRQEATQKNDAAGRLLYKLAMNSLYGKFAANPERYKYHMIVPMDDIPALDDCGWQFAGELGNWALAEAPLPENARHYYNVATGASITGFVRAMLWRAICSSGGVLYCDTDSIACRTIGDAIKIGDKLGEWKNEGAFDKAGIAGKKLYIFRGIPNKLQKGKREYKTAAKGVRLTNDQLWQVARGKRVTYQSIAPTFSVRKEATFIERKISLTT